MPLLFSLAMDAEAGEPVKTPEISCATTQEMNGPAREITDNLCLTESSLRGELERVFPGKIEEVMFSEGLPGAYEVTLVDGQKISTNFDESSGSSYCVYRRDYKTKYPTLETLRDETVHYKFFIPETQGIDGNSLFPVNYALSFSKPDATGEDALYAKTYENFDLMVTFLEKAIRTGQEKGWGDMQTVDKIRRLHNLGQFETGLSRAAIKKYILSSEEFKKLTPEAKKVFTDYADGKGSIITALTQMEPIKDQCSGKSPYASEPFYK